MSRVVFGKVKNQTKTSSVTQKEKEKPRLTSETPSTSLVFVNGYNTRSNNSGEKLAKSTRKNNKLPSHIDLIAQKFSLPIDHRM